MVDASFNNFTNAHIFMRIPKSSLCFNILRLFYIEPMNIRKLSLILVILNIKARIDYIFIMKSV